MYGRSAAVPFTYLRLSTDEFSKITTGEGEFTDDLIDTFGGYGVAASPRLQSLLSLMCQNG
ncbi:MAG: hypothetical protein R3E39_24180 [Anaerolineae bacterium]